MLEMSSTLLTILLAVLGGYVALLKYTISQKEKSIEVNDARLTKEVEQLEARLSFVSGRQSELSSELKMQELRHDHLLSAFKEIRESMVTKSEFDATRRATQETLQMILFELRRGKTASQQFYSPTFQDPNKVK